MDASRHPPLFVRCLLLGTKVAPQGMPPILRLPFHGIVAINAVPSGAIVMNFVAKTERLLLRPIAPIDWVVFRDYSLSDRAKLSMGTDNVGDAWRSFAYLIGHQQLKGFAPQAIVLRHGEDRAIGVAGPHFPPDWPEPELGWQIWDASCEGKGYAFEAVVAARSWSAETFGWRRMASYIKEENVRSIRLAERLGCTLDETAKRRPDGSPVWRHPE